MTYLFAAYSIVFLAIFAYTLYLGSTQRKLAAELDNLERALRDRSPGRL